MSRKVALITGGTSGIGLAIAQSLAKDFDLALVYSSDEERALSVKNSLSNGLVKVEVFQQDIGQLSSLPDLYKNISEKLGRPPLVLVNSAGRLRDGLFLSLDFQEQFVATIQEHLLASVALSQLCLKAMSAARFGRIINLSSISAQFAKRGQTSYATAKAGIEGFTKTLALEVAHRGVTVNAIAPGLIETNMTKELLTKITEAEGGFRKRIPAGRPGEAREVGALAAFLCSADAAYITGTTLTIDGGRSLGDPQS